LKVKFKLGKDNEYRKEQIVNGTTNPKTERSIERDGRPIE